MGCEETGRVSRNVFRSVIEGTATAPGFFRKSDLVNSFVRGLKTALWNQITQYVR